MSVTVLFGTASDVSPKCDAAHSGPTNPTTPQSRQFTLKIDGKPVLLRTRFGVPAINDGDKVAVVGRMMESTLEADAFRNLSTGACDYPAIWSAAITAGLLILFGISIVEHTWLWLIIVAAGVWTFWRALVAHQTIQALIDVTNRSVSRRSHLR